MMRLIKRANRLQTHQGVSQIAGQTINLKAKISNRQHSCNESKILKRSISFLTKSFCHGARLASWITSTLTFKFHPRCFILLCECSMTICHAQKTTLSRSTDIEQSQKELQVPKEAQASRKSPPLKWYWVFQFQKVLQVGAFHLNLVKRKNPRIIKSPQSYTYLKKITINFCKRKVLVLLEAKNQALDQVRDLHRVITAKFQIV